MICLKICTFVVSKTTRCCPTAVNLALWFAWKSVPLWYLKQRGNSGQRGLHVVICLKICTFVVSKTTLMGLETYCWSLWFAWKSVPLWYLKQHSSQICGYKSVVICLKICTFVVSKTTEYLQLPVSRALWFAWKSVPLWYLKQPASKSTLSSSCCDLLENLYLCGI